MKGHNLPTSGPLDAQGREILLSLEHVDVSFGKGAQSHRAVKDASFCIYKGETFSLVGESGSGKTTIGRAIIRVTPCAKGQIRFKGIRIDRGIGRKLERRIIRQIQMVFQDPAASLNERATVEDIVSEGLRNFRLYQDDAHRHEKVEKIVREVGLLPEHLSRYPHEFSGGQRQRIGLARAMVMEPELVIADEPISALDVSVRAQVLNLMKKFQRERGVTYLFIAHDLSIVRFISDRIGVIYQGNIVEIAGAEELFDYPLHPYTRSLISAVPIPDPILEKAKVLQTYDPSAHDYSREQPKLVDIGHGHMVFGNEEEIAAYRALRERGEKLPSVTFRQSAQPEPQPTESQIAPPPAHDTGSGWYTLSSFLLPPVGLVGAALFRRANHMKNYAACKKGALAGLATVGAVVAGFGSLLMMAAF